MEQSEPAAPTGYLIPGIAGVVSAALVLILVFYIDSLLKTDAESRLDELVESRLNEVSANLQLLVMQKFSELDVVGYQIANRKGQPVSFDEKIKGFNWVYLLPERLAANLSGSFNEAPARIRKLLISKYGGQSDSITSDPNYKGILAHAPNGDGHEIILIKNFRRPFFREDVGLGKPVFAVAGVSADWLVTQVQIGVSDLKLKLFINSGKRWAQMQVASDHFLPGSRVSELKLDFLNSQFLLSAVPEGGWQPLDRNRMLLWLLGGLCATTLGWVAFLLAYWRDRVRFSQNILEMRVLESTGEVRKQESFLRTILNHIDNGIIVLDRNGRVVFYNQLYMDTWGFSSADMEGKPRFTKLIRIAAEHGMYRNETVHEFAQRRLEEIRKTGLENKIQLPRLDGVILQAYSVEMPDGGYLVSYKDMTKTLSAEKQAQASTQRYENLFQGVEVAILETDLTRIGKELERLKLEEVPSVNLYLHENIDVLWDIVRSIVVLNANGAALRMFGAADYGDLKRNFGRLIPDESIGVFVDLIAAMNSGRELFRAESVMRKVDGTEIVVILSLPIPSDLNSLKSTPISILDISKRKRSELALRELAKISSSDLGKQFYSRLVTALASLMDTAYVVLAVARDNKEFGFESIAWSAELSSDLHADLFAENTPMETILAGRISIYPEQLRQYYPDSKIFQALQIESFMGTPLFDTSGETMACLLVMDTKPIGNRRGSLELLSIFAERAGAELQLQRGQEALLESEQLFRSVFETAAIGMSQLDLDGRIMRVNQSFAAIFGYSETELEELDVNRLTHADDREPTSNIIRRLVEGEIPGDSYHSQKRYIHADGSTVQAEVTVALVQDTSGAPLYAIAEIQDITDRLQSAAEREQLGLQLRQAQKMESIGHLTGGIAHDFNNILAAILGYAVLAQERFGEQMEESLTRYISEIVRAGERARDLIAQMLAFSRGMEGEVHLVDIVPVVKEVSKLLQSTLPSTISINYELQKELPKIKIDLVQFHQVMMNLCVNARDAMKSKGELRVAIEKQQLKSKRYCVSCHKRFKGEYLVVRVSDTGIGIDPEVIDRIFDPFFTTKDVGRGTGMGLSVVHGIMHQHQGHIEIKSQKGVGTNVSVYFPIFDDVAADETPEVLISARHAVSGRIMVVDDEQVILDFMRELLEMHQCEVTTFSNSAEAFRVFSESPDKFDLIITDQTMPEMTGMELSRAVLGNRPNMPIIICTGFSQDINEEEVLNQGVRKFLMKPIDTSQLLSAIQELLHPPDQVKVSKNTKPLI